jgi:acyl-CoA synthetase (AMP-forming)/AMP-acid ligase II
MNSEAARAVVADRLGTLFEEFAGQPAIELAAGEARQWWTWGDVGALHRRLAAALDDAAAQPDAPIALVMRQRPEMLAAELSVLAQGRTALLVTPLQPDRTLAADVGAIPSAVLVAHALEWERPGFADAARAAGVLGIAVGEDLSVTIRQPVDALRAADPIDAAVTVQTSGTTGPPKRMPARWEDFVELGGGPRGRTPGAGSGTLILSLPLVTLGGMQTITRLIFGGRPMAMMERFDVHTWAGLVREHRPKVMGAPPPVVKMILDADISPEHFEGVTAYMTSSAPLAPAVAAEFQRRYGIPVLLGYGATEFLASVSGWTADLWERFGATKLGSVGRARPGVGLRVIDAGTLDAPTPAEVPPGAEGILEVDPPHRAGQLPGGWLRTADRARIDDDGFLWILGRADDVIVRGGFKVRAGEVEDALVGHERVREAVVVGIPDRRLGSVPAAMVTVRGDGVPVTGEELRAHVRSRLAPYKVPVVVRIVDEIPRNAMMKPRRAEIREALGGAR